MANLAIIPARGGSKRIPRKNIKVFSGKPIIAYSIEAALTSNLFDEVMVSTDDAEIAEVSLDYGAKIPFLRSASNSDDYASTVDVIKEVLQYYSLQGKTFDYIACIYPTVPFISSVKLKEAYKLIENTNIHSVFPVVRSNFPYQRCLKLIGDKIEYVHPEYADYRSQDLEKSYYDAGQFYFFKSSAYLENIGLISTNTKVLILSELEAQDINTNVDWKLAELKYRLLNED